MDQFVNLHVHSHYSIDSMIQPDKLVERIAEMGQSAIALTDHGTLAGIVDMYLACKEKKIKFIPGCEFYLHYFDKDDGKGKVIPEINHITILAKNNQGFKNLVKLNNLAHENTYKRRSGSVPLMTLDMLYDVRDGLHILTGCPASALFHGDYGFAYHYVKQLTNAVGRDHVSVELMFSMDDPMYIKRPLDIAQDQQLPLVITPDSHFLREEHKVMHPYVVQARKGFDYESSRLFVYSYADMQRFASEHISSEQIQASLDHIQQIVNSIEPIDIESEPVLPIPDDAWVKLYAYSLEQLEEDVRTHPETEQIRRQRFATEIDVITGSGFQKYFCLLHDIISYCRESGIAYNVRGSAAGCYLLYLWKISSLDPIRFGLLFERFLNVHRNDFPDVDVDIESNKRDAVLKYAWDKWGMRGVATFTTYNHKNLVHDLCRVLELPKDLELAAAEGDENCQAFKMLCEKCPLFGEIYEEILGQIRHRGKHAGAICSIKNIDVPLERFEADGPLIAYSESGAIKTLSKVGGVKLDILGVAKLDQLAMMAQLTGVVPPEHPDDYPAEIFDTICSGKLTGLFQLGASPGVRNLTLQIQPRSFEDVALISALYRPGALDAFPIDDLVRFKTEPRKLHPVIDNLLKDSYSIMVYQENVMDIFATVTGTGLAGADMARRQLTPKTKKVENDPKWVAEKERLQSEFINKGIANGFDANLLTTLWNNIDKFVRYGFNKSHSYSYARFTIMDAWYRTYYPEAFYTALLQSEMESNGANLQQYIFDAVKAGLKVVMPHINTSKGSDFVLQDKKIYLPLSIVKGLGPATLKAIMDYREANGSFSSFTALNEAIAPKQMNRTLRAKLYSVGAFTDIEGAPEDFQINVEESEKYNPFEVLGFIIPKEIVLREIDKYKGNTGFVVGIVTDIIKKNTKNGKPMKRIVVAPEGSFWFLLTDKLFVNKPDAIQKGMFIRAAVDNFNRCLGVVKYKVE